jgi:hypothetical protein
MRRFGMHHAQADVESGVWNGENEILLDKDTRGENAIVKLKDEIGAV